MHFVGYNAYHLPKCGNTAGNGCLILVKNSIPHTAIEQPVQCGEGVETQAVKLHLNGTELHVYNVYRSQRFELDLTQLLSMAEVANVFIGGDFNAHHEILGSRSPANAAGRHLAVLLSELDGVKLLNTDEPTHLQGNALDLTFVSATLADRADWSLHPTLTSDHFASMTTLDIPLQRPENKAPKWYFKKAIS